MRGIRQVEELEPQLQPEALPQPKLFQNREIQIGQAGASHQLPARIAQIGFLRSRKADCRKGAGVEIATLLKVSQANPYVLPYDSEMPARTILGGIAGARQTATAPGSRQCRQLCQAADAHDAVSFERPLATAQPLWLLQGAHEAGGDIGTAAALPCGYLRVRAQWTRPIYGSLGEVRSDHLLGRPAFLDPLL